MKTLNLMPDAVQIILPKGKAHILPFEFPYSISGYTYTCKIIDSENAVVATLTYTPDTVNNIVNVAISASNALLIETGQKWYLQETRSESLSIVIAAGAVECIQVTDL
ncbi:MAG TPA: hypothetical protein VFM18_10165 [Methanosarcina sp.]|nr:hypothetical protein [Methanosarcina sp.]